jgi:hypothetical protein
MMTMFLIAASYPQMTALASPRAGRQSRDLTILRLSSDEEENYIALIV